MVSDFPHPSRMDGLRQKLESQGLKDVVYMVVNHQGAQAQRLHTMLEQRLSEHITLYKQEEQQPDVWRTLSGGKDDFLIYDRFVTCSGHFYIYIFILIFLCFLFFNNNSFLSTFDQVWPSHPPHFTSVLRHRSRPCGGCNQRYLLQTDVWRVHT